MDTSLPSYWVGLEIPGTDCHVTIAFRDHCTPEQLEWLKKGLQYELQPLLPLHLRLGGFQKRGTPPTVPAYNVFVGDAQASGDVSPEACADALQEFYHKYTWRAPPKPEYPRLEMHASCAEDERRQQLERIIRDQDGYFVINEAYIRPLGSKKEVARVGATPRWALHLSRPQGVGKNKNE